MATQTPQELDASNPTSWVLKNPQSMSAAALAAANTQNINTEEGKKTRESILEFFSTTGPIQSTLGGISKGIDRFGETINGTKLPSQIDEDVYKRLKYQYANLYVATATGAATSALGDASKGVATALDSASKKINETLKPVSSFIGSTLYTLTNVMQSPLGSPRDLPNTIGYMMDRVNPNLKAKFTATYKKFQVDKLMEMPGQLFGSALQIIRTVDKILSYPINLLNDIYRGFMDLVSQVNDFINGIFESLQKFFSSIIDGLIPGLTGFLNQVTVFANQIGGIVQVFSGSNQILGFTNQLTNFANQINGFVQNPMNLIAAQLPNQITEGLYMLQNPQQIINQFLPPQLSEYTQQISSITGFGFNGNMGFGLQSVLEGLQGGVLSSILKGFATQFSILAPIFTGESVVPEFFPNQADTTEVDKNTKYSTDKTSGQPVPTTPPSPNYTASQETASQDGVMQ